MLELSPYWSLVATLAVDGQPIAGLELRGQTNPKRAPQRMELILRIGSVDLGRMALRPSGSHTNSALGVPRLRFAPGVPREYRGLQDPDWPPPRGGTRIAQAIATPLDDAAALIRYCRQTWNIVSDIPEPPFTPELAL